MASFDPGTVCWFPDEKEGWVSYHVTDKQVDGDIVKLTLLPDNENAYLPEWSVELQIANNGKLPPLRNPPILEATEDLTNLSYLNEPAVLNTIRTRYAQLQIYTYSGIVLIATNPFQNMSQIYSQDIVQAYAGRRRGELEPHLFAIAEDAYRCMLRDNANQTIVVSGESGAGKTVSAKYIMRYFATVEDPDKPPKKKKSTLTNGTKKGEMSKTEEQILATNPIMESFGNAKTTRNDNSSRFGKYIEILFDTASEIIGARIRTYLLERSRLVFQPKIERNYHIFYQLCAGAPFGLRAELGLGSVDDFYYMKQGGEPVIHGVDDAAEFRLTCEALDTIGIKSERQTQIFRILAALLHVGNIPIQASRTDATLSPDESSLVKACDLLGLDAASFAKWTIKKQISTRTEKIITNLSQKQAIVVRDSVAKYIYSSLFDWLVRTVNVSLADDQVRSRVHTFIGVLDIYGFEHFQKNSFEQFCINYANEKLQQEESRLPSGTDDTWVTKLYQHFAVPKHEKFFKKPRFGKTAFTVCHYALDVTYEAEGFLEKNRDTLPDEHLEVLIASENNLLKECLQVTAETPPKAPESGIPKRSGMSSRKPTLGSIFKGSLIDLMTTIDSTNVHYIRCIKPNEAKIAWKFEPQMVLNQLRACGVLETIRISCAGFPSRWTYEEFATRYYLLVRSGLWSPTMDIKELCTGILKHTITEEDRFQMGLTKIFFRAGMLAYLERRRSDRLNACAIIVQKNMLRYLYRKRYIQIKRSVLAIQALTRGYIARQKAKQMREDRAATKIQSVYRGWKTRQSYDQVRLQIIKFQAVARGCFVRSQFNRLRSELAAGKIQTAWRRYRARKNYIHIYRNVIYLQCCYRRKMAKKELKQLRIEAKSASHFKEVSYKLENKVVELTQNLTKRTQENKVLLSQVAALEISLKDWQDRHLSSENRLSVLQDEAVKGNEAIVKLGLLEIEMQSLQATYAETKAKIKNMDRESTILRTSLTSKAAELESALIQQADSEAIQSSLSAEVERLRDEVQRLSIPGVLASPSCNGNLSRKPSQLLAPVAGKRQNRGLRRRSANATPIKDHLAHSVYNPRPASLAITPSRLRNALSNSGTPNGLSGISSVDDEILNILEDDDLMNEEVMLGLIQSLKIPQPSSTNPPSEREIMFPAHLINLITSEMWKYGYVKESERFLANVMQSIQQQVMTYEGEEAILPGAFWISNVHEMLSFVFIAEKDMLLNSSSEMDEAEWQEFDRLVSIVKHDLESLEYNIYHTWMKELKKRLYKMTIPAVIESQSLPGFHTTDGNRFFNKLLPGAHNPMYSMDDLLNVLNKVHKAIRSYYVEQSIEHQTFIELLKLVGVTAFNDLLMRRNFLSWKRGLQINYNLTRIEEWCKSHEMPEGVLQLEHLMQATKMLQLKKSTLGDIEIIYDICWMLTPTQVQKLINQYYVADYEHPIPSDILKAVAMRVKADDSTDALLLDAVPLDDSGSYEIPSPREIKTLETYVPSCTPFTESITDE
ncbi:Myosin-2 [Neolecta irregularis DAH-3]|uniref:Myosin-2 n=1 Tax=Neolecta irregularis (strain DAH-3) TaxID=1198029 RepID=A0A1U7LIA6_NEOID|nr:Myosin-2 [Neolecta irregularis DAH-3]|eukprot:OLL22261.1 Myosin-2 [Neolecta irregularis DAH-3]